MSSLMSTIAPDSMEAARRPLDGAQCALIVVDIQEKLLPHIFNKETVVKNSQLLIRLARILSIPAMVTTEYSKGLGATVPEIASLVADVRTIDRLEFGCFSNDEFRSGLKKLPGNRNTVLLCGVEAHICVTQTALGALNDGYLVHVASDAVGSRSEWNWKIGLDRMRAAGAVISSTEMMMYELLRCSGTPQFKELLPYIK
ncbi:MAG TPA: hydrolase [Terriglobales bacterium]|nr:hydrolase [Terriglobales bacterium]